MNHHLAVLDKYPIVISQYPADIVKYLTVRDSTSRHLNSSAVTCSAATGYSGANSDRITCQPISPLCVVLACLVVTGFVCDRFNWISNYPMNTDTH